VIVVFAVKVTEAPWIVIVNVPVVALLLADRVRVLVVAVLVGLKDAVTPWGRPEADKLALPVNPFCGVTVIVDATWPARARLSELGEAERARFGAAVTVSESVVLCDNAPDVPVIVMVTVPSVAELLAVRVSVLDVVVPAGLNAAVTAVGKPVAERLTLPLNPFSGATVIVLFPLAPWARLRLFGEADSE
jgi:hypothetical protein